MGVTNHQRFIVIQTVNGVDKVTVGPLFAKLANGRVTGPDKIQWFTLNDSSKDHKVEVKDFTPSDPVNPGGFTIQKIKAGDFRQRLSTAKHDYAKGNYKYVIYLDGKPQPVLDVRTEGGECELEIYAD